jgi:hypothetical protein
VGEEQEGSTRKQPKGMTNASATNFDAPEIQLCNLQGLLSLVLLLTQCITSLTPTLDVQYLEALQE